MKSDLHNCVSFIQEPKTLKDNIQMIYARYVQQTERVSVLRKTPRAGWMLGGLEIKLSSVCHVWKVERTNADDTVQKALRHQCDRQERTVNGLKMRLVKSAEEHEKVYTKIMKVSHYPDHNSTLALVINIATLKS